MLCECGKEIKTLSKFNLNRSLKNYGRQLCRSCKQREQYKNGSRKPAEQTFWKAQKGKKIEEIVGEEKGKIFRETMSKATMGEKNSNFGGSYFGPRFLEKGQTFDEVYGLEKSRIIKKKLSDAQIGEKNNMFGKPAPRGSGNGWSGWFKGHYFRSIMELSYLKYLYDNNIEFEIAETKKHAIPYHMDGAERNYFPDFYLKNSDVYIEVKPASLLGAYTNRHKFEAAKNKLGDSFIIITEKDMHILKTDDIVEIFNRGDIVWLDRYDEKFRERYL